MRAKNKLNPHIAPGRQLSLGYIGERRAFSPLSHSCFAKYLIISLYRKRQEAETFGHFQVSRVLGVGFGVAVDITKAY